MSTIKEVMNGLMEIEGALGCAVVDYSSGMLLGSAGSGVDLELAAAGNSEVVRAKMKTMKSLGIEGNIEDILITLENQLHIIRPSSSNDGLFIYVVLDKRQANLALARRKTTDLEQSMKRV